MAEPKIILASKSPRRQTLLYALGLQFTSLDSKVNEEILTGEDPAQAVMRIAELKARTVSDREYSIIIAADTLVFCSGKILGQPKNYEEAYYQLSLLSGKEHRVYTGLCVLPANGIVDVQYEMSAVHFRNLSKEEITAYLSTKESFDKAGSYGIQGKGALLITRIEGCPYNVMGLPLTRLYLMLKKQGVDILLEEIIHG